MELTRRHILAWLASLIVVPSGVVGAIKLREQGYDEGYSRAEERYEERMEPSMLDDEVRSVERNATLGAGQHEAIELSLDEQSYIEIIVVAETYVDILIMEQSDYPAYENGDDPQHMPYYSELDTSETFITETIQSGDFQIVIDNTTLGKATPTSSEPIETDVEFRLSVHQK